MFPDVRQRLEEAGVEVPDAGGMMLFHAGPSSRLDRVEREHLVPPSPDDDGQWRTYVASSIAILEAIPHADGVIEVEVDVGVHLELGLGDSPTKNWVELAYESKDGLPILSARRLP